MKRIKKMLGVLVLITFLNNTTMVAQSGSDTVTTTSEYPQTDTKATGTGSGENKSSQWGLAGLLGLLGLLGLGKRKPNDSYRSTR
jgi:MYXO-CTERM domain-containing protein